MKITRAGLGALGSGFGYYLQKSGHEITLLDHWEAHIEAVNTKDLTITVNDVEDTLEMTMYQPSELKEKMDIIFVFTKSMGLESMMEDIEHLIGDDTKIVCLLNGLGHAQTLEKYLDKKNIVMGTTVWTAGLDAPGITHMKGSGPVELQNSDPQEKEAALEIVNILQEAGLNGVYSDNVDYTTWRKACVNGTVNALSVLLDANIKQVFDTSTVDEIIE